MKFSRTILMAVTASAFLLQACTTSAEDEYLDIRFMSEAEFNQLPLKQQELMLTNYYLEVLYVNADKELQNYSYYQDQGEKNGYSETRYEFPDVEYMYSTLSDNFTKYFSPALTETIMSRLFYSEEEIGIGADFEEIIGISCVAEGFCNDSNTLVFKHVYLNGPADKIGIQKGDTLYHINGLVPRNEQQLERIIAVFDAGESIPISVKRGEEIIPLTITFDTYMTPTVFVDEVDSIPVITITEFTDSTTMESGTYGEFIEALNQTEGAEATILDLRGNPGGTVPLCIAMAAELLPKNDTVITIVEHTADSITDEPYIDTTIYVTDKDGIAANRYYVILADAGSASCAEIMIAGVASNTKSPIVGSTTYGKGIGQSYLGTVAGGLTGITNLKFLDKNWNSYHKYGIVPDFEESNKDRAMQKAVELAQAKTATRTAGYGTVDTGHFTLAKSKSEKTFDRGAFKYYSDPNKFLPKRFPLN